jgi:hypothetical protein
MTDGIVLQTQFLSPPTDTSTVSVIPSASSLPSLATKKNKYLYKFGPFGLIIVLLLIILIIVAVIVSRISSSSIPIEISSRIANKSLEKNGSSALADSISLEHMLVHLRQFESRAIGTVSFNRTIDYLTSQLTKESSLIVQKYYFSVPQIVLGDNPVLLALPNTSNASIFTYPRDFIAMDQSAEARNWSINTGRPLSFVGRLGCHLEDWNSINPGDVVLVRRGNCTFVHKILMAISKRASAFLVYNDGLTIDRLEPLNFTRAPRNNTIPTLFLSNEAGMRLILENITRIYMRLEFRSLPPAIVTNVCADTRTGDANRTIVVGSHSDSVAAGKLIGIQEGGESVFLLLVTRTWSE